MSSDASNTTSLTGSVTSTFSTSSILTTDPPTSSPTISFSTTVTVTESSTSLTTPTSITTSTPPTVTSSISLPPSTTFVPPSTTPTSPSVIIVTSTSTQTPSPGTSQSPSVVIVTSTYSPEAPTSHTPTLSSPTTRSSTSPTPSALSASGSGSGSSSGSLSSGAKIAIAVIIPIAVIAAAFLIGFFCWRKRKARKNAEELRKNEMAEYGFNPNSDPTLVATAGAYTDTQSEAQEDNSGYRGWGATSSNRKASTTLGSNGRAANGLAMSESSSQPGGYAPNAFDPYSVDPAMNGHPEGGDGVGALGGAAAVAGGLTRNRSGAADIRRGPSNASSAYSTGHQSEDSSDGGNVPGTYYQEEVPYNIYNEAAPSHGPYGDGSYGGAAGQPVIRDVQARRNTRIERAPTFPQTQGGISQNF